MRFVMLALMALFFTQCGNDATDMATIPPMPLAVIDISDVPSLMKQLQKPNQQLAHIPLFDQAKALLTNHMHVDCQQATLSYHNAGSSAFHWILTIQRKDWPQWHPKKLQEARSRQYAGASLWTLPTGYCGETANTLFFSPSELLVEEGLRQVQNQADQPAWADQLRDNQALVLGDWSEWKTKQLPTSSLHDWLLDGNRVSQVNLVHAMDSSGASSLMLQGNEPGKQLEIFEGQPAATFPGWTWMNGRMLWATWRVASGEVIWKGQTHDLTALGQLTFKGRRRQRIEARAIQVSSSSTGIITDWRSTDSLVIHIPGLSLKPWVKSFGQTLMVTDDTLAFNRYVNTLGQPRDSTQSKQKRNALNWLQSQPAYGHIWVVSPHENGGWKGISGHLLRGEMQWHYSAIHRWAD